MTAVPTTPISGEREATAGLSAATKAAVLCDALPYIRRFAGRIVVAKYGGSAIGDEQETLARFAEDIVLLRSIGLLPVVGHGGCPQIGALMDRLGKVPEFRDGLRVTDSETLDIARMVLVGKVNRDIVGAINVHGPLAVGLSGEDAGHILDTFLITRRKEDQQFGEYRTKRVILEVFDAMDEAERTGVPYQTRLDPPPADPRVAHSPSTAGSAPVQRS